MSGLRVVLVAARNPLNIGAAARAMSNFGFTELHLVRPYDAAFREARSAVRSGYILEQACVHETMAPALEGCALVVGTTSLGNRDLQVPLYRLETAAPTIRDHLDSSSAALLFGSEKFGLSNEDISYCHWLLRIPSRDEHGSMNLGQAVAICLYELVRDSSVSQQLHQRGDTADAGQSERITQELLEALTISGYVNERTAESTGLKVRRLVRRLGIPASDAETWMGMLRQIVWKLKREKTDGGSS